MVLGGAIHSGGRVRVVVSFLEEREVGVAGVAAMLAEGRKPAEARLRNLCKKKWEEGQT